MNSVSFYVTVSRLCNCLHQWMFAAGMFCFSLRSTSIQSGKNSRFHCTGSDLIASFLFFVFLFFFPKIYFIMVVYSYINALREDPSGTSAGFSPSLPGGNKTPDDNYISIVVMLHDFRSQIHYEYFCVTEQKQATMEDGLTCYLRTKVVDLRHEQLRFFFSN